MANFYATSEQDAFAWLRKHLSTPRGLRSTIIFNEDNFLQGLQGRPLFAAGGGRKLEQSLFKQPSPPGFALTYSEENYKLPSGPASHTTTSVFEENSEDDDASPALSDFDHKPNNRSPNKLAGPAKKIIPWKEPLKPANIIAKARSQTTSSSSGVLTAKSTPHKRTNPQKLKPSRPIIPAAKPELKTEQTMLMFDNTPEGMRTAVNIAIKEGLIEEGKDVQIKHLMQFLVDTKNRKTKGDTDIEKSVGKGGALLGRVREEREGEGGTLSESSNTSTKTIVDHDEKSETLKFMGDDDDTKTPKAKNADNTATQEGKQTEPGKPQRLNGKARKLARQGGRK